MKSAPRLLSHLAGFVAIGMVLAALTLTFRARGHPQVAQQPYPPPQTPTPGPYPPPATPIPTFTPLPTQTPGGPPTPPPPPPRPTDIVLPTSVPPEVMDALTQPIQITTRPAPRDQLDLDGNYVVWRSYENGQTNIVVYNLAANKEQVVSSSPWGKGSPRVDGRYVVWLETYVNASNEYITEIHAYNLSTQQEMILGRGIRPDISGQIVVWYDPWHDPDHPTVIYNLSTAQQYRPADVHGGAAKISGNWIIYGLPAPNMGDNVGELYAYNLRTRENIRLGYFPSRNDASQGTEYAINDNLVIWRGLPQAQGRQVHVYDLHTRQEYILTDPPSFDQPRLAQGILLAGIYAFNITRSGVKLQLFQSGLQYRLDELVHDGHTVAWIAGPRDQKHVYIAQFRRLP